MKYVCFLRGVNFSGKNRISMANLKEVFITEGFTNVITYLNSGNVIFESEERNTSNLKHLIESLIESHFELSIPVLVIDQIGLSYLVHNAPAWWNTFDKSRYVTLLLMIPPVSSEEVFNDLDKWDPNIETVEVTNSGIYWSFILDDYTKTAYYKLASKEISKHITIRTINTIVKLLSIMDK